MAEKTREQRIQELEAQLHADREEHTRQLENARREGEID
jgi:hypothetical protein